jgi:hypothetical protein
MVQEKGIVKWGCVVAFENKAQRKKQKRLNRVSICLEVNCCEGSTGLAKE